MMKMEVSGKITIKGNLNGRIGQEKPIKGQVGYAQTKPLPWYEGEYEVTPKWEDIVINTKQKSMRDDVTVTEIPYLEVENPQGGVTVVIGGL